MLPDAFFAAAAAELDRARAAFAPFHSLHEAYAVILEEVDELWDCTKVNQQRRAPEDIQAELIQIAAMCARAAVDLGPDYAR